MNKYTTYFFFAFLCLAVAGWSTQVFAQQADTTKRTLEINPKPESFIDRPHTERRMGEFILPESGIFEYPEPTRYYQAPFMGQYYLDVAVAALREEQRNRLDGTWMKVLRAIAPFVNMQFQFGVYEIYDIPVVDRDNPLFQSYRNREDIE